MRGTQLVDPTLPGAPVAAPLSRWATWRCTRDGRRDRKGPGPDQATGHFAYTLRKQGEIAVSEAMVGRALHSAVAPIDRQFVSACARIAQHHQNAAEIDGAVGTPGDAPPGSLAASELEREREFRQGEREGHRKSEQELAAGLSGLLATRQHLIDAARTLVRGHAARFSQIAATHRRGFESRSRGGGAPMPMPAPVPSYTATQPWFDDDLPILVASIDPATREVIDWALRQFDNPRRLRAV